MAAAAAALAAAPAAAAIPPRAFKPYHRLSIWKLNAIHLPYGKKDGEYLRPCPPSMKYSTPPHAQHTRQTSSNHACQPLHCRPYCRRGLRQLNWEIMTKLSTCSAPAAMLVGTGTSGVINLQYASSFRINQLTTGYAAFETSAASAISVKIAEPYANRLAYWAN
jgi:hypothetical protein